MPLPKVPGSIPGLATYFLFLRKIDSRKVVVSYWLKYLYQVLINSLKGLRPNFTSKLVHVLAFGTPKFYIAPYDKIKHELVNLSSNSDVKSSLSLPTFSVAILG